MVVTSCFAQEPAPSDVQLTVSTENGRTQFHLGEEIRLQLRYAATVDHKYLLVGSGVGAKGWQEGRLVCTSGEGRVPITVTDRRVSASNFLHQSCSAEIEPLSKKETHGPRRFQPIGVSPLVRELIANDVLELTHPGNYLCSFTDGTLVESPKTLDVDALRLTSNPISFSIADESAWSANTLKEMLDRLSANKCVPENDSYRCGEVAEQLRQLDTPDSLAAMTQMLNGGDKLPSWQKQLWLGLFQSRHQDDVIRLLEMRYTDPDFGVTVENMETITGIRLRKAFPQAFASTARPEDYRSAAVFLLQETLRKLGDSLPAKSPLTKAISTKTYETLASQDFCEKEPIIPEAERKRVLKQAFVAGTGTPK